MNIVTCNCVGKKICRVFNFIDFMGDLYLCLKNIMQHLYLMHMHAKFNLLKHKKHTKIWYASENVIKWENFSLVIFDELPCTKSL